MRSISLFGVLAISCAWSAARAQTPMGIQAVNDSGVTFEMSRCYEESPPFGYHPVTLRVVNQTGRDRVWAVDSEFSRDFRDKSTTRRTWTFAVGDGAAHQASLLLPLPPMNDNTRSWMSGSVEVIGPAIMRREANFSSQPPSNEPRMTVLVGTSLRSSAPTLKKIGGHDVHYLLGSAECLSADPRAYLGVDVVFLTKDEVEGLRPNVRRAIESFVFTGGLLLVHQYGTEDAPSKLRFAEVYRPSTYGLGRMEVVRSSEEELRPHETFREVLATVTPKNVVLHRPGALAKQYEPIEIRRGILLALLVGFGILIGPINVFVFARRKRRSRLIWTTPLLSTTAGLVLAGTILVEDGVGGSGDRQAVHLVAADHKAVYTYQVQAARTGLLMGSRLETPPDVFIDVLPGVASYPGRYDVSDTEHGGDWFRTRRVQAHWMYRVESSRARVSLLSTEETPVISSTIDAVLESLIYVDARGNFWSASKVSPGDRVTLEPADRATFETWREASLSTGHDVLVETAASPLPGWFYASAADPSTKMLPSYEALRWRNRGSAWVGPVLGEFDR